ncbi:MAG: glycerol-3-phosphate 1-O-acyltransferase PlsY [Phascolarctobacterium sp.]|nr:glycerol-3-phosphate 1-O-acyltransferase PlsY [Phascolarctobacterium sp.]
MTGMFSIVAEFILGYLCGSIPSGLWIVKTLYNIDIRKYGSKNIGTTNVFRTVGIGAAALVLLADMLKGIVAVAIINFMFHDAAANLIAAIGALLGHNYSLFLNFKGGKGVATGLGLLLFLMPKVSAADLIIWLVLVILTRYVSLGSVTAAAVTPILAWYFNYPGPYVIFGTFAGIFVIIRHKDNILRLLSGTENKISPGSVKDLQKK